jgi:SP family sugar:H+ symporter-like MFS transporter
MFLRNQVAEKTNKNKTKCRHQKPYLKPYKMSDQHQESTHIESYNLPRVIFLAFVAAIGGFLFGFDSGVINGTVDALQVAFNSDAAGTGFNVASVLLGCVAGAFFAGTLADRF